MVGETLQSNCIQDPLDMQEKGWRINHNTDSTVEKLKLKNDQKVDV